MPKPCVPSAVLREFVGVVDSDGDIDSLDVHDWLTVDDTVCEGVGNGEGVTVRVVDDDFVAVAEGGLKVICTDW